VIVDDEKMQRHKKYGNHLGRAAGSFAPIMINDPLLEVALRACGAQVPPRPELN
jgi:hypothetical protein